MANRTKQDTAAEELLGSQARIRGLPINANPYLEWMGNSRLHDEMILDLLYAWDTGWMITNQNMTGGDKTMRM